MIEMVRGDIIANRIWQKFVPGAESIKRGTECRIVRCRTFPNDGKESTSEVGGGRIHWLFRNSRARGALRNVRSMLAPNNNAGRAVSFNER